MLVAVYITVCTILLDIHRLALARGFAYFHTTYQRMYIQTLGPRLQAMLVPDHMVVNMAALLFAMGD